MGARGSAPIELPWTRKRSLETTELVNAIYEEFDYMFR